MLAQLKHCSYTARIRAQARLNCHRRQYEYTPDEQPERSGVRTSGLAWVRCQSSLLSRWRACCWGCCQPSAGNDLHWHGLDG